ncbi:MAG: autotransporter outer membrane beta-barrel domain-containing protein [Candidatus Accumulibacter sp.]|jgi:hypothetical protein|nr:autotransporter outer membrane beta-barrel domain-containing protein [Accumulibacter sp.]
MSHLIIAPPPPAFSRRKIFLNVLAALPALAVVGALSVPGSVMAANVYDGVTINGSAATGNDITSSANPLGTGNEAIAPGIGSGSLSAEGNDVVVGSSYVGSGSGNGYDIVGGGSQSGGEVKNNSVTVNDGITINGLVVGGAGSSSSADLSITGNTVTVHDGEVQGVQGGTAKVTGSANVTVSGNKVFLEEDAKVSGDSYGGLSDNTGGTGKSTVTENELRVTGEGNTTIDGAVHGGGVQGFGDADKNIVTVTNATVSDGAGGGIVFAEMASKVSSASENKVTLTNSDSGAEVYGAKIVYRQSGIEAHADKNQVTLTGSGTVTDSVFGAYFLYSSGSLAANSTANENIVDISGYSITKDVIGGVIQFSCNGDVISIASGNKVTINASTVGGDVFGGQVYDTGKADGNIVTLTGDLDIDRSVGGGIVGLFWNTGTTAYQSTTHGGSADGNQVIINGKGTLGDGTTTGTMIVGGDVDGSQTTNTANNNTVSITATGALAIQTENGVAGAYVGGGKAAGNSVTLNGAAGKITVDSNVSGALVEGSGDAEGNRVTLSGNVEAKEDVLGGWVDGTGNANYNIVTLNDNAKVTDNGDIIGGVVDTGDGNAIGNSVNLNGHAEVYANVYGGYVAGDGKATSNTVNIGADVTLDSSVRLYGGRVTGSSGGNDAFTGNTLNTLGWKGSVASVNGFQFYNLEVPAILADGEAIVTLTDTNTGSSNLDGSVINVTTTAASALTSGSAIAFKATTPGAITGTPTLANGSSQVQGGIALLGVARLESDNSAVRVVFDNVHAHPQTKAFAESYLGGTAALNQAADLSTGQGITALLARTERQNGGFAAIGYGDSRYETGSHVNAKGYNVLAGIGASTQVSAGRLSGGVFVETGEGDYDTHNSFHGYASVKGDGDTRYTGGGVLGRLDLAGGAYFEASLRAGTLKNDYTGKFAADGVRAKYDAKSGYLGSHLGAGYVWKLQPGLGAEVYGKYLWTHQKGDSVTVKGDVENHPLKFSAVDSQRLRIGGRLTWNLSAQTDAYVGAAYEHEFDGDASARIHGYRIDTPSLDGDTGIGEVGVVLRPAANSPLSLQAGVQAYGGDRKGATGHFNLKYAF